MKSEFTIKIDRSLDAHGEYVYTVTNVITNTIMGIFYNPYYVGLFIKSVMN